MLNYDDKDCLLFQRKGVRPPFTWIANWYMIDSTSVRWTYKPGSWFCTYMPTMFVTRTFCPQLVELMMNDLKDICYPTPTVIGKAISMFSENNPVTKTHECIPAISMMGTVPAFYLIPVTPRWIQYYPSEETVALRFVPRVPIQENYPDGMLSFGNRRIILQSLEAFKALIAHVCSPFPRSSPYLKFLLHMNPENNFVWSVHSVNRDVYYYRAVNTMLAAWRDNEPQRMSLSTVQRLLIVRYNIHRQNYSCILRRKKG